MSDTDLSPRARFGLRFVMLARHWRQALNERLAVIGFSDATWAPLVHLALGGENMNQKELAARLGIDTSTLVRLLDILCERGDIARTPDPADRRSKRLVLTDQGRASVKEIRRILAEAETDMLAGIDDAEIDSLLGAFDRIESRISR